MTASLYLAAMLAPAAVPAGPPKIPGPTLAVSPDPIQGFSPKITGAARVEDAAIELLKRYVDYDQTCGFVDGDLASALTCSGVDICATNSILGVAGCCNPLSLDSCYLFTSCVAASQLSSCTASSCLLNDAVAKCTDSTAPYCVDWDYDFITTTMKAYGCDVSAFTGTVERTYSGQDTYDISSYLTSVAEFSFPTVFVTQTQIVSAGLTSGTAASSSSHGSTTQKKSHLGAIVGGVVGGLAALVLLAAVVIFILFKKRRDKKRAAAAASAAAFQQNQQQPPPPPPMAYGPPGAPGAPGPNDYKPPPMGAPPAQQQQQQYGAPPPQMQQPSNTMSFYAPPPPPAAQSGDVKHEYSQQSVSSVPGSPGPYSPPLSPSPLSPSPQYSPPAGQPQQQQQWNPNVPQIDGTPVHMNSEGNRIHEAP